MPYVNDLCERNDMVFLCEHWLLPDEIKAVTDIFTELWSILKSSVDPEKILTGRPYGGIGFLCREASNMAYRHFPCESDRICADEVFVDQCVVLTVFGIYLPYNNHTQEQMDLYIETLDLLQCLLETASMKGPTVIVADMNTTLPQMETLSPYWYKKSPFSYRSALLHDFLLANDLIVANYCYHHHTYM